MKRVTFDENDDLGTRQPALEMGHYGTCWSCQGATPKATLMDVGGMCFPCFQSYKAAPQPPQKLPVKRAPQRTWLTQLEDESA